MTSETRRRAFTGLQPPGNPQPGNCAGALQNWVRRQDERDNCASLRTCQIK
jgi:tryptophanyl-tRNA synthetase